MEIRNVIISSKPLHKFYKSLANRFRKLSENRQQKEYSFISILYPTANSCLIKYELLNQRIKYELVIQGDFRKHYISRSTDDNYIPNDFNFEEVIKRMHSRSHIINN